MSSERCSIFCRNRKPARVLPPIPAKANKISPAKVTNKASARSTCRAENLPSHLDQRDHLCSRSVITIAIPGDAANNYPHLGLFGLGHPCGLGAGVLVFNCVTATAHPAA